MACVFVLGYQFWWIKDVSPRQWYKSFRTYRTFFSVIKPHSSCSLPSLYIVNANCCCLLSLQQGDRHFKEEDDSSTCSNNNNNDINGISTRKCCASCDYTIGPTAISCVRLLVEILGQSSRWKYAIVGDAQISLRANTIGRRKSPCQTPTRSTQPFSRTPTCDTQRRTLKRDEYS